MKIKNKTFNWGVSIAVFTAMIVSNTSILVSFLISGCVFYIFTLDDLITRLAITLRNRNVVLDEKIDITRRLMYEHISKGDHND